ncbi:MAG: hypothetical protein ABSA92_03005 [Candidatus Bathyarchaeia archaeon]
MEKTGLSPKQLLELDIKEAREQVMDIVRDYLEDKRYANAPTRLEYEPLGPLRGLIN